MITSTHHAEENLLHFTLDGLLPSTQTLIINPATRTAILLTQSPHEPTTPLVVQRSFSPNGMRLLIPLLEAYPHYCTYETLLTHLFPLSPEQTHHLLETNWTLAIRPIRRAIGSMSGGLRSLGLRIRNIRGAGYLIEPVMHRTH